jgi:hypothetical protein
VRLLSQDRGNLTKGTLVCTYRVSPSCSTPKTDCKSLLADEIIAHRGKDVYENARFESNCTMHCV